MVAKPKQPQQPEPPDLLDQLSVEDLKALVLTLQQQVREIQEENERLRAGAFTRWDQPVPSETDEERSKRITGDPRVTVHRRPAGPLPPFEPWIRLEGNVDVLRLLGRRDDDDEQGPDPGRDRAEEAAER